MFADYNAWLAKSRSTTRSSQGREPTRSELTGMTAEFVAPRAMTAVKGQTRQARIDLGGRRLGARKKGFDAKTGIGRGRLRFDEKKLRSERRLLPVATAIDVGNVGLSGLQGLDVRKREDEKLRLIRKQNEDIRKLVERYEGRRLP